MSAGVDPYLPLDLASGLLWTVTYVLIVRRSALDRTTGVPLLALASALSWELIYTVVRPMPVLPRLTVPLWLAVDACVLYQVLRHGAAEARRMNEVPAWFFVKTAAALAGVLGIEYALVLDWNDVDGAWSGFAVNVVVSFAFIAMLERRRDVRGQSMPIAIAKLAGSAIAIPHAYALHGSLRSIRAFMGATVIGDIAYAALLLRQYRAQGISPWPRV